MSTIVESATPSTTQRICAYDVSWETYLAISEGLTGRHVRLTYDRGTLEFMTISSEHARLARLFQQLVVALVDEFELPLVCCGDMTCRRESVQRGLEPDECFYIAHAQLVQEKSELDFETDPPPDLVVEIDLSRPRRDRLDVYGGLGVPEVWTFDGRTLVGHGLTGDEYERIDSSRSFPTLRIVELLPFVDRRHETDDRAIVRSFQSWVRANVVERE